MNKIISVILITLFCLVACSKKNVMQTVNPDPLYQEAIHLFKSGKYEKASKKFLEFKNRFPFDKRITEVQMKYCDSLYKAELYVDAENAYLEFIKLHPKNKLVPYAYYQLGMVQFNQISTIDRDKSKLFYAYKYFSILTEKFPSTKYAVIANHRLNECKRKMAKNNFYIGYFYFKKERYRAAIARFERVLKIYPGYIDDKVLYYLGKSYIDTNNKKKATIILKELINRFKESKYRHRAAILLKKMKKDKFNLFARIKEYYFYSEEDVNDKYYTPGFKNFAYPPATDLSTNLALLESQGRTFTTLQTSKEIKQEYNESEAESKESGVSDKIPLNVSANNFKYFDNNSKVMFTGNVVISRGDLTVTCDKLIAFLNKKGKSIFKVEATGNIDILYLTKEGKCDKLTYYVSQNKMVLTGEPYFQDGKTVITGSKIIYFTKSQRIFVVGNGKKRSKITIKGE